MAVLGVVSNTQVAVKQFAGRIAMHETTLIRNLLVLEREDWVLKDSGGRRRRERRPGNTMKNLSVVALGATAIMTVRVAYPVDTDHDGGDRSAPRDNDRRCDPATIAATNGVSATTETARQRPGW